MAISVFELFSIGIGPSSSHTVGPMRAAGRFLDSLDANRLLPSVAKLVVEFYGSLAATGRGHGSDRAVVSGLAGADAETVDPDHVPLLFEQVRSLHRLTLRGGYDIAFEPDHDLRFVRKSLPYHPNGLKFTVFDDAENVIAARIYYSIGGGFVVEEHDARQDQLVSADSINLPFPFRSGKELLALAYKHQCSISDLMLENEKHWRSGEDVRRGLQRIWSAMQSCVERGCKREGVLPGGLRVRRRAAPLYQKLIGDNQCGPMSAMDWVDLWALAVNEENAAGGRVVTAPTNGAAGIIPSVMHYYHHYVPNANDEGIVRFLLTAGAIGTLFKLNASISGAEVGCQGEVGSACSMAAAGLTEILGGTPAQVENAAEIGMEHNLGLTCDPIGGLVQVPCIERNAMAAVKAINASRLALRGDGHHFVSLDKVIKTMRATGADMKSKYKETSRGGLAVNVTEC